MSFSIKINEPLNIDDVNEIFKTIDWNSRTKQVWSEIIKKSTLWIQILKNDKVIGFGRIVDDGYFCMIYDIVVHSDCQKQGIGKMIMNEILKYIKEQNFKYVSLFYWEENNGLDEFYKKIGFYNVKNAMRLKNNDLL